MRESKMSKQDILNIVEELKVMIEEYNRSNKDSKFLIDLNLVYQEREKYGKLDSSNKKSSMLDIKYSNKKDARYYTLVDGDVIIGGNVLKFEDLKGKKKK